MPTRDTLANLATAARCWRPAWARYAAARCGDEGEGIAQEAFERALQTDQELPTKERANAFVFGVLRRVILERHRAHQRRPLRLSELRPPPNDPLGPSALESGVFLREVVVLVEEEFGPSSLHARTFALWLRGFTVRESAEHLQRPPSTVHDILKLVLKVLRSKLG